jgi:hypothetical protein
MQGFARGLTRLLARGVAEAELVAGRALLGLYVVVVWFLFWAMLGGARSAVVIGFYAFLLAPIPTWIGMHLSRNCVRRGQLCRALVLRSPGPLAWALLAWILQG